MKSLKKNRIRSEYTFANINLLGKCNVDCFFCLGKDIEKLFAKHNQLAVHFSKWKNFDKFLKKCKELNIKKIYLTGQNTDPLLYLYLEDLISFIKEQGFSVGMRTNGYLAKQKINIINKCTDEIGYSIHSLNPEINFLIMKRKDIPDWDYIIPNTRNVRVSIVINRYNIKEFWDLLKYISAFENVKYIQVRRISTDTRESFLLEDIKLYEALFDEVNKKYPKIGEFYLAQQYMIFGKEVNFWRTVETSANSINYFTDGTLSDEYFIIEGYLKHYKGDGDER